MKRLYIALAAFIFSMLISIQKGRKEELGTKISLWIGGLAYGTLLAVIVLVMAPTAEIVDNYPRIRARMNRIFLGG